MPRTGPPVIRIEEAIANDRRMDLNQHSLPAGTRRLEVSFTVLTFSASNRIRFRYRLDGFDTDWVDAGPRRTVFYTNLSPRDYRFRVEAHAEDGTWSTSAADWPFTIQPAIYQTRWFYALVVDDDRRVRRARMAIPSRARAPSVLAGARRTCASQPRDSRHAAAKPGRRGVAVRWHRERARPLLRQCTRTVDAHSTPGRGLHP